MFVSGFEFLKNSIIPYFDGTLKIVVIGLPAGTLVLYVGEPRRKIGMDRSIVAVEIPKPHFQPLLSSIHTTNVTAIKAPQDKQNT